MKLKHFAHALLLALLTVFAGAPQAAVLFTENFNQADGAPDADWAQTGGGTDFTTVSNELTCSVSGNRSLAVVNGVLADIANVKVTFKRASGGGYDAGVFVRGSFGGTTSNTGSGYIINPFSSQIDIIRRSGGSNSAVGSKTSLTLADNDVIAVEITGTGATVTFRIWLNSVELTPAITDTSGSRITTAGDVGFFVFQSGSMHDDFQVEDVAAPPAGGLMHRRRRAANDDTFDRPLKVAGL